MNAHETCNFSFMLAQTNVRTIALSIREKYRLNECTRVRRNEVCFDGNMFAFVYHPYQTSFAEIQTLIE